MASMSLEAITGIILKSVPYEEHTHIITVFSKERGKVLLAVRQSKKTKREGFSPLLAVDALVCPAEKEMWKCRNCEITNSFPRLRQNLDTLRYAVGVTQILADTLPFQAEVHELYDSFLLFLRHLPLFHHAHVAAAAFLAKLCVHEGLLGISPPLSQEEVTVSLELAKRSFEELYAASCEKALLRKLAVVVLRS